LRVLAISAHTDDAIVLAGGTLTRFVDEGHSIHYVGLSLAEKSIPLNFPKQVLNDECHEAVSKLGIPRDRVLLSYFPVRQFPKYRQKVLEALRMLSEYKPELVLVHGSVDIHQDHQVVYQEALRAFKNCSIIGYNCPWNVFGGERQNLFVRLTDEQLKRKLTAVKCFKSQIAKGSPYFTPEYLRGLAVERGSRIGVQYAEAFEVIREIK